MLDFVLVDDTLTLVVSVCLSTTVRRCLVNGPVWRIMVSNVEKRRCQQWGIVGEVLIPRMFTLEPRAEWIQLGPESGVRAVGVSEKTPH